MYIGWRCGVLYKYRDKQLAEKFLHTELYTLSAPRSYKLPYNSSWYINGFYADKSKYAENAHTRA